MGQDLCHSLCRTLISSAWPLQKIGASDDIAWPSLTAGDVVKFGVVFQLERSSGTGYNLLHGMI